VVEGSRDCRVSTSACRVVTRAERFTSDLLSGRGVGPDDGSTNYAFLDHASTHFPVDQIPGHCPKIGQRTSAWKHFIRTVGRSLMMPSRGRSPATCRYGFKTMSVPMTASVQELESIENSSLTPWERMIVSRFHPRNSGGTRHREIGTCSSRTGTRSWMTLNEEDGGVASGTKTHTARGEHFNRDFVLTGGTVSRCRPGHGTRWINSQTRRGEPNSRGQVAGYFR